jgi:hypothetical protein
MADFGKILQAFNQGGGQPGAMQPLQSPIGMPPIDNKADKNQQLGMMLYALGGVLRGDKNFVQNTLAIKNMQEGKKKEEERKKNYKEMIDNMDPNSPLYNLAKSVGYEGIDKVAQAQFDLETRVPKEDNIADYKAYLAKKYKEGTPLTAQDRELESFVFNLSSFERYARGSGAGSSEGQDESNPISVSNYEDAEAYPKGTWVNFNGNVVQVD